MYKTKRRIEKNNFKKAVWINLENGFDIFS